MKRTENKTYMLGGQKLLESENFRKEERGIELAEKVSSANWHYLLFNFNAKSAHLNENQKRDLISLCQTTPAEFWLNFPHKTLTSTDYHQVCQKIRRLKILDIGTGCGNLAICLAKVNPQWKITATDISKKALKIAQKNVLLHQAKNVKIEEVKEKESNLFNENSEAKKTKKYNVIITNPPYINEKEHHELPFSTKQQPKRALVAQNDGY
ncbi:24910_t:CDS:2 [Entrophospora sp. SA101]|nr:24910_t:CDS:2 [Entrophospora sp. SA101]CAJ0830343.1 1831_t:CDS:2 [Entrophospora sp. SA101]